jgi:hypothetical protein
MSTHVPVESRTARVPAALADLLVGGALAGVAVWFLIGARQLSEGPGADPGTFPGGAALLLLIASTVLMVKAVATLARRVTSDRLEFRRPLALLAGIISVAAFPFAMGAFGFYPTVAVWMPLFLWLANTRRVPVIIGTTIGFLVFTKLVFEITLGTPLP